MAEKTPNEKRVVANPTYTPLPPSSAGYKSFNSFYPFYLGEHSNVVCRRLHLVGTSISSIIVARVLISRLPDLLPNIKELNVFKLDIASWKLLLAGVGQGYFMAWVGHFFFEHNKPATFKYPVYSFIGDFRMLWEVLTLKRSA